MPLTIRDLKPCRCGRHPKMAVKADDRRDFSQLPRVHLRVWCPANCPDMVVRADYAQGRSDAESGPALQKVLEGWNAIATLGAPLSPAHGGAHGQA